MKIIDKTPFRQEDGSISFIDRIQASLKYGLGWYERIQAQEKIIPVLEKHLGRNFILMRNVTLGGTDIEIPMILIGPPAVLVINVLMDKGVFRAQEDEWGKITGDQFAPAKINQITRTARLGKVLQVFLEKNGLKGLVAVESVLFAANPGTHVESVRPIVRVVMSDAFERFAASLSQAKSSLGPEVCAAIAQVILGGKPVGQASQAADSAESQAKTNAQVEPDENQYFFSEESSTGNDVSGEASLRGNESKTAKSAKEKPASKKTARIMGLTLMQIAILVSILVLWLCIIIFFFAFFTAQLNA